MLSYIMEYFSCQKCNYYTLLRPNYKRHLQSEKHKNSLNVTYGITPTKKKNETNFL